MAPEDLTPEVLERFEALRPLAVRIAGKVALRTTSFLEYDDCLQDALIGALDAAKKYDDTRKVPLEAYAAGRIRGEIFDGARARDHISRVFRQKELRANYQAGLAITLEDYRAGQRSTQFFADSHVTLLSLDMGLGGEDARAYIDLVNPDNTDEEERDRQANAELVREAVEHLPDRIRHVVIEYYWNERTLSEIASDLGVTESRICQMVAKARLDMTQHLRRLGLFGERLTRAA